ncbi:MAG: DUF1080 domain-containing protein [Armatimonadota bacterium]|nr:DUF1080 domain-containing protein [Armatimonadota bacterium]
MLRKPVALLLVTIALIIPVPSQAADCCAKDTRGAQGDKAFAPLFNGKDLSGWEVVGAQNWSVADAVLSSSGEGYGWLKTEKHYRDFVLQVEYKLKADGNSGVFLRATRDGDPAFTGMEIQIRDDYGKEPNKHICGALYDAIAPSENACKPAGEWNKFQISLIGNKLSVWQNGKRTIRADLASPAINKDLTEDHKLTKRAKVGFIGLQNHGEPVQFRNIRIREL